MAVGATLGISVSPLSLLDAYLTLAQPEPHTPRGAQKGGHPHPHGPPHSYYLPPRTQENSPPARGALGRTVPRSLISHRASTLRQCIMRGAAPLRRHLYLSTHAQRWLSAGPGAQGSASGPYAAPASASGACADLASASGRDRASRTISRSRRSPPRRLRCWHGGRCRRASACRGRKRSRPPPSVSRRRPWACRT